MQAINYNPIIFFITYFQLIIGTVTVFALKNKFSQDSFFELKARVKSWWFIIILLTLALAINLNYMIFFFGYISFLALKEFFTIIPTRKIDRRVLFWAYLSIPIQFLLIKYQWYNLFVIFIPIYLFLFIPMRMTILGQTSGFLKSSGTIHWGVMLTVYCLSHIAYLGVLPTGDSLSVSGIDYILYLIFLTQFNDVAQYCCGKLIGGRKIIAKISPNKTISGFLGGVFFTTLLSCLIYSFVTPFNLKYAIISGLIISISGFIGDVVMSAIKRDLGIKDTGSTIPGHGGILDRLDSLLFTAPLFFHFVNFLYY